MSGGDGAARDGMPERVLLGHGAGGRLTRELVTQSFVPRLANPLLAPLGDSAVLPELGPGRVALTTDGFVVDPPVFAGGDIGYLSVCGTVNDLAVAGARPLYLSWALILEEGLEGSLLAQVVDGAARAAAEAGVQLVTGDTKVVPRGKADRLFVTTSGVGLVPPGRELDDRRIEAGDAVVVTGPVGDHGATVLAARHDVEARTLASDVAPLAGLVEAAFASGAALRSLHDPTRGGLATVAHEVAVRAGLRVVLDEDAIPIRPEVAAVGDLLGVDPLYLACEGRAVLFVAAADADRLVAALRAHPLGRDAAVIGAVDPRPDGRLPLILRTRFGGERPLDLLTGMDLPRIC